MIEEGQMSLEEWGQSKPVEEVSLSQMDDMLRKLCDLRDTYDRAKEVSSEAHKELKAFEAELIKTLNAAQKSSYKLDGVATVTVVTKEQYNTPEDEQAKLSLFAYIRAKYGAEALHALLSINSRTLNSWANSEAATGVMQIPGLSQPTVVETISLRRNK